MAQVSITQAAKLAGKARSHFYAGYIKPGKITVSTDDEGKKYIDTSELIRVFGSLKGLTEQDSTEGVSEDGTAHQIRTAKDDNTISGRQLQDTLHALLEEKERHITLLAGELEQARQRERWLKEQLDTTTKMLEHKDQGTVHKKGFWARMFGR